eukprot:4638078-Prymnesium_polylepis.1
MSGLSSTLSPRLPSRVSPRGSPRGVPTAARIPVAGTVVPGKYSLLKGFSHFSYMEDPFELGERERRASRGPSRPGTAGSDTPGTHASPSPRPVFKTTALPPAPRNAGAFQQFRYALDPYELKDEKRQEAARREKAKLAAGAFLAGGNARSGGGARRLRLPELRTQMHRTFRNDWQCYRGISVDEKGMLVVAFAVENLGAPTPARRPARPRRAHARPTTLPT